MTWEDFCTNCGCECDLLDEAVYYSKWDTTCSIFRCDVCNLTFIVDESTYDVKQISSSLKYK